MSEFLPVTSFFLTEKHRHTILNSTRSREGFSAVGALSILSQRSIQEVGGN